ncbi:hypothetical protein T492DRAFT_979692 [Pavlovales sp. CCMP2436]|nr:hypothetical protein T492DRAFT_979692 [Pavlovales sp. CCMP2436]
MPVSCRCRRRSSFGSSSAGVSCDSSAARRSISDGSPAGRRQNSCRARIAAATARSSKAPTGVSPSASSRLKTCVVVSGGAAESSTRSACARRCTSSSSAATSSRAASSSRAACSARRTLSRKEVVVYPARRLASLSAPHVASVRRASTRASNSNSSLEAMACSSSA